MEAKFIIQMEKSKTTITNLKASSGLGWLQFCELCVCFRVEWLVGKYNTSAVSTALLSLFSSPRQLALGLGLVTKQKG